MSYVRWGQDGSSVYVIGIEAPGPRWLCVQCKFTRGESFVADTRAEMIAHLLAHRERGDTVPESAIERLREEMAEP